MKIIVLFFRALQLNPFAVVNTFGRESSFPYMFPQLLQLQGYLLGNITPKRFQVQFVAKTQFLVQQFLSFISSSVNRKKNDRKHSNC